MRTYLAPRYWLTWLALSLLWCVAHSPYRVQMALGKWIGRLFYRVAGHRRRVAEVNVSLCFPELTPDQRARFVKAHFVSVGQGLIETAMSWWSTGKRLAPLLHIEGLEHLQGALATGHGAILLSAHFTSFELGGRLLARRVPFHVMYRRHENPLFEAIMKRSREARFEKAIPREDIRAMLRSLKENKPVWFAPDQNYSAEHSAFVSFFNIPASTITSTSRLAKISGAPVVPFFTHRLPENAGYLLRLLPMLENFPSDDVQQDTQRLSTLLEAEIRRSPEQYLWVHRRFKTRPPGEAGVY